MSYSCKYDNQLKRPIGCAVDGICDHPGCKKAISRGVGNLCCQDLNHTASCNGYFCEDHLIQYVFKDELAGMSPEELCAIGATVDQVVHDEYDGIFKCMHAPIEHKEHPAMFAMMEKDESWKEWREKYPEVLIDLRLKVVVDYEE